MLLAWDIDFDAAGTAYDYITEHGKKHMDCKWKKPSLVLLVPTIVFLALFRQSLFRIHEEILHE